MPFGGREHALTGAYDYADPSVTDLRAINGAVLACYPAAAAATVEAYLNASALRMVKSYRHRDEPHLGLHDVAPQNVRR